MAAADFQRKLDEACRRQVPRINLSRATSGHNFRLEVSSFGLKFGLGMEILRQNLKA